jgi:hypothetical protein
MRNYKIIFSKGALKDLEEAKSWYNTQQKGLGKRLILDVKNTTGIIKRNPYFASVKFENIRTAACKIFPILFIMKLTKKIGWLELFPYFILTENLIGYNSNNL